VSDEWVVPLCALHHRALHGVGREETWRQDRKLDPLAEARKLWRESHPVSLIASGAGHRTDGDLNRDLEFGKLA